MIERLLAGRWAFRALFVLAAALLVFVRMLPLSTVPSSWAGPDLLLCVAFAWVLRRPDYVPVLLIAVVFLVEDLLAMRPPGLWALIVLLGSEILRSREPLARALPFWLEWAMVALVMLAMFAVNRAVLLVAMVPEAGLGLAAGQLALTALAYPVVVALSKAALGVRKAAPGAVDAMGRRL